MNDDIILEVKDLRVHFQLDEGTLKAVDGVDLKIRKGTTLGLVGESGCGKSVTSHALLGLIPKPGKVTGQILQYERKGVRLPSPVDIAAYHPNSREIREIRGEEIAMIFQEPMKAFSPIHTIGNQIMEGILIHSEPNKEKARELALDALRRVGMSNPEQRIDEYPHQLSGGMRQRAMIAMAVACNPSILIADEPTTALDVTVQAQVLKLINELKENHGGTVIFITHDLGVIAEMTDFVAVMHLGKVVEYADVDTIFHNAQHPYTRLLLESIPSVLSEHKARLATIEGTVPFPMNLKPGCGFYSRCPSRIEGSCNAQDVDAVEIEPGHFVRCHQAKKAEPKGDASRE